VIEHLAPTDGVELVNVTDEDEYFPPPRELRELLPALVNLLAGALGATVDPGAARGSLPDDRSHDASTVLADLAP
jgi:4-hydroxy-3-methylbut-2-enyl diphosphate reductase